MNLIEDQGKETWAEVVNRSMRQPKPKETPEIIGTKPNEETQLRARNCLAWLYVGKLDSSTTKENMTTCSETTWQGKLNAESWKPKDTTTLSRWVSPTETWRK